LQLAPQVKGIIRQCMEGAIKLEVPLKVNMKEGETWDQLR
jgi:DNA polymerase I-like protein with 3'-5' exonuclease and polymerase domains